MEWNKRVEISKKAKETLNDFHFFVSGLLSCRETKKEMRKVLVKFFRNKGFDGGFTFLLDDVEDGYMVIMYFFGESEEMDAEEELGVVTPLL